MKAEWILLFSPLFFSKLVFSLSVLDKRSMADETRAF
jgi:hypothetical protein